MEALKRDTAAADAPHLAIYVSALGRGGAERAMLNLANELAGSGVDVDVLIAKRRDSGYIGLLAPEVRVVDLQSDPAALGFFKLLRHVRLERPDVLLTVEPGGHAMSVAARALAGYRLESAGSVQNFHSREYSADISLSRRLTLAAMRTALQRMDHVIAVSNRVAKDLNEHFAVPEGIIEVIPNPIVTPELDLKAREDPDHPWFDGHGPPVVLSVGRLTRQKNYQLLLQAFAMVRCHSDARLLILGEGEERESLEKLAAEVGIADAVSLPGFVDNPFAYMARASLFVLSSDWEGLPSVLIEALALGCPIVSTDCPSGPREILEGERHGRLVPPGDPESLAEAILEALEREWDRERLKERGREFSSDRVARAYANRLIGRPSRPVPVRAEQGGTGT